ncbi:BTB/POZ domain-containing protein [Phanerochaete sordida]|uniref:BTB/POZ domain-containing protein n=1 Tax=Phanerochaete sordida TaxID=48140 RepID=A0A9P3GPU6_9APHY|nr:BTB/POZ domain-containing protein [Phanerochaete sordida]
MNGHGGPSNGAGTAEAGGEQYANHVGPSSGVNGYAQPTPYQLHNEAIVHHLFHAGFQTGNYADTVLHVLQNMYRLHAIILSRSPFLAHLMSTSPQTGGQRTIYVHLEQEPEVTHEGFAIAMGYLYSAESLNSLRPENARAVLAAACLLGGMDDLCGYAYELCRQSISIENIGEWLEFVEAIPPPASDGSSTPVEPHQMQQPPRTAVFGPYAQRLREDVFHFLAVRLPSVLNVGTMSTPATPQTDAGAPSDAGRDTLLQIYARVPFDLFKAAVESPTFQIGSDQARFKFAKDAIELRKRGVARGQGAEETVVLAFGGGNFGGSAVHVTRKLRKRPLWKVNAS